MARKEDEDGEHVGLPTCKPTALQHPPFSSKYSNYPQAMHPTEKAFRPSHRASVYGSILHDASYEAILELSGPEDKLKRILTLCCDPQGAGPGAARYAFWYMAFYNQTDKFMLFSAMQLHQRF